MSTRSANGELTDAYLAAITVGERKPHNAPVELSEYDPAWPVQYELEADKIRGTLGAVVLALEHVGSTSVPGLAAKPILDIVLVVADPAEEAAYVPALEAAGYRLHIREPDWHEHRLLKGAAPTVHLHVFGSGSDEVRRVLAFRDRLRTHDDERALYEATKRRLAARVWKHVQNYADAKGDVVEAIIARALAET